MANAKKTIDLGGRVRLGGRQRSIARRHIRAAVSTSAWPVRFATMSATARRSTTRSEQTWGSHPENHSLRSQRHWPR